ncbi:SseB family protein [Cellulomonas sp. URHD0024]|uniref:SseB family protein n=1 Tax=Cellulomonas sp. URHD0024 TaxID=1302620 RepID=UPI0004119619
MTVAGRELPPSSPFAGDDGTADAGVASALRALEEGTGSVAAVVDALHGTRVLVPVLAELEVEDVVVHDGHAHTVDKEASAGIVALQAPDGRTALPVFTSVATMTAWRPDARPVPSDVARAALSAVTEGWEVLVVDPGGPTTVLLPRPAVWALAQQQAWEPAVGPDGVDPAVRVAIVEAVSAVRGVVAVDAVVGTRAEVAVVVDLVAGLDRAGLDAVLGSVNQALGTVELVAARVDSLELRPRSAR